MSANPSFKPLPARPNLEFAHKQAKALLRGWHDHDATSLSRLTAYHPKWPRAPRDPSVLTLADAQLVVAREHGFTSWPVFSRTFLYRVGG